MQSKDSGTVFELNGSTYVDVPAENTYLEGEYTDYVKVTQVQPNTPAGKYTITTDGQVSSTYLQQSSTNPAT